MNKVILMGRLTRDPEVRYSQGDNSMAIARYTLAVDRRFNRNNDESSADFIGCVAFGRAGEFAEKYFRKGLKVLVTGRIQTGSYTNRDGVKVYTTDVVVEDQEFAESKNSNSAGMDGGYNGGYGGGSRTPEPSGAGDGFMNIPDGIDEELPFN
ncbi:MAG: single-stranded DNA-binding protein [Lachnospiraceae bacterium]|nr:single-stranded DNA-binding protein [Lachnospiraceae bacterium]MDE6964301.1 single-stranded DNA-binding protein [Lachnospiraceae bacterium]